MAEATQMILLPIPISYNLHDKAWAGSNTWLEALELIESRPGFQRMYWGRRYEDPEVTQLHIVSDEMQSHLDFLSSSAFTTFKNLLAPLLSGELIIRHAQISEFSSGCKSLGKGAPVTGTAIYLSTDASWDAAWANWVSIVQHVPGFLGIAGGRVLEAVDGHENAFVALVGWESVEIHDAYHHTKHFRDRRRILLDPCCGFNYYGHVLFGSSGSGGTGLPKL